MAAVTICVRGDGGLDQSGSSGDSEKWPDSSGLNVALTGFTDG